jgi:ABC-type Zn2+ transport system substrate-binding protein/surface adhesin
VTSTQLFLSLLQLGQVVVEIVHLTQQCVMTLGQPAVNEQQDQHQHEQEREQHPHDGLHREHAEPFHDRDHAARLSVIAAHPLSARFRM